MLSSAVFQSAHLRTCARSHPRPSQPALHTGSACKHPSLSMQRPVQQVRSRSRLRPWPCAGNRFPRFSVRAKTGSGLLPEVGLMWAYARVRTMSHIHTLGIHRLASACKHPSLPRQRPVQQVRSRYRPRPRPCEGKHFPCLSETAGLNETRLCCCLKLDILAYARVFAPSHPCAILILLAVPANIQVCRGSVPCIISARGTDPAPGMPAFAPSQP